MSVELNDRSSKDPIAVINVTPLVDVCLVLVIIFMVTAPLIAQNGIKINSIKKEVGAGAPQATPEASEVIFIKLTPAGRYLNEKLMAPEIFPISLKELLARSPEKTVYITAEGPVPYGQVVEVLDISRQCGAERLAVLNDKEGALERTLVSYKN